MTLDTDTDTPRPISVDLSPRHAWQQLIPLCYACVQLRDIGNGRSGEVFVIFTVLLAAGGLHRSQILRDDVALREFELLGGCQQERNARQRRGSRHMGTFGSLGL
jgi:hypothetical protein